MESPATSEAEMGNAPPVVDQMGDIDAEGPTERPTESPLPIADQREREKAKSAELQRKLDNIKDTLLAPEASQQRCPTSPVTNNPIKTEDFHPTAPRITYSHAALETWLVDYMEYFGTVGLADFLYDHGFISNHALASLDCSAVLTCMPNLNLGAAAELVTFIQGNVNESNSSRSPSKAFMAAMAVKLCNPGPYLEPLILTQPM